ncbi:ABC transporter permease [Vallitalea sediminicola]
MIKLTKVIIAEIKRTRRDRLFAKSSYFNLLIWPIALLATTYYSYKPFNLKESSVESLTNNDSVIAFLICGFLGYLCFFSLVESAWQMSRERQNGTLEAIFLSPVNKIAILYGRAVGNIVINIWMFLCFTLFIIYFVKGVMVTNIIYLPVCFLVLIISAVIWGGFMNSIFLFSRDASILFNILDEPMSIFSGVRMSTQVFPLWAKLISNIFPLTHSLIIVRGLMTGTDINTMAVIYYFVTNIAMIIITIFIYKSAERHSRKNGQLLFY